ncbi:outer membrane protein assembly factor BamB family protein [Methanoculleus frigidifontis]|nr:PQQ-binding-like beta-propeller repeat protein [Methanoculleus sp. FWC-SCC1]
MYKNVRILGVLVLLALFIPMAGCAQENATGNATEAVPPEVIEYATDWPLPNYDYNNSRATMDSAIDADTVNDLGTAWTFAIPATGTFGAASSNPIVMGETVYFQDLNASVFALDLGNGSVIWEQPYDNASVAGPNGPAVGWGKVFVAKDPFSMAALNATTGEEIWAQKLVLKTNETGTLIGEGIDIQPSVYDGLVLTSTVPGTGDVFYEPGSIGVIYALDQETGEVAWNFSTVDSPDLWGNPDVNSGGGCWYSPAVDTERSVTYWGVGNPAPWPGTEEWPNGTSRPGPNLYTNSILALGAENGSLNWYTQTVPHDLFDYDLQIPPILTNASVAGEEQDLVIGAGKMGRVYAFNRDSGSLLWVAVVGEHQNDQIAGIPPNETVTVYPGYFGGVETPMAYADGVVFVPSLDLFANYTSTQVGGQEPFNESVGRLTAIEVETGKILWDKELASPNFGGATVVNDLVFTATFDGTILACDRATGDEVWNMTAPAGINAWPAVANDTIVWPAGAGDEPVLLALRLGAAGGNVTMPQNVTGNQTANQTQNMTQNQTMNQTAGMDNMTMNQTTGNVTGMPNVTITMPENGSGVSAGNVTVAIEVANFSLVDSLGQSAVTGEGHVHYYMDVEPLPTQQGSPAVPENGSYAVSTNTSYTWENVTAGNHTFAVQLVNNDHTPLDPPVTAAVNVTANQTAENVTENQTMQENVTVGLTAENIAFNTSTITVPAGAAVTMDFTNLDNVPHNFAAYETAEASDAIFVGEVIGQGEITYTFTAPETPGTYFFRCDVHPVAMTGDFIVE